MGAYRGEGITDLVSLEQASRFTLEVAKRFTSGSIEIYYEPNTGS